MLIAPNLHFQRLPLSARLTYTMTLLVLGLGYLFASIHVFSSHAGRDGNPGLSVTDLIIAYSGSKSDTRLEAALKGPMQGMLPAGERNTIVAWVRREASQQEYEADIAPIIEKRCLACHSGANPHVPDFSAFQGVADLVTMDTGMDIFTLVRVSHIHLFGITFIFFITSIIFSHAYVRPVWFKCVVIAIPFIGIIFDVAAWYLTKIYGGFAWFVLGGGALMGLSFAIQFLVSLYQMWFYRVPEDLERSDGRVPYYGQDPDKDG
ncbi:MAG: hypothetical protein U9R74_06895 [Pseudomonadota bacterium]|nr:hypothetical protein [Pseudomonadota bacterium]